MMKRLNKSGPTPSRANLVIAVMESMTYMRRVFHAKPLAPGLCATPAQMGVLVAIVKAGLTGIKEVAAEFRMSPSAATQLVDGLVDAGLLVREEDAKDRRKIRLTVTPSGLTVLAKARKERLRSLSQVLKPLTDAELKQLAALQRKILSCLHA